VASRFNELVVSKLVDGVLSCFRKHGLSDEDVDLVWTPGAFELPVVAKRMAESGHYDAVLCLGAVIRGETPHFEFIAAEAARGIQRTALDTGIPVLFGVLTTDTLEQALDRAGGKHGNKGWDVAMAAMEMADVMESLPKGGGSDQA
jgi:6,7-dimethyl-8-ribityllumazine synthase